MTKKRNLKILFNTNAPWVPSGYGMQARQILPRIRDMEGVEVACICFYGLEGGKIFLDDMWMFPKLMHVYGGDAMWKHQRSWGADCVITLQDIWTLHPNDLKETKNWIPILPIDHTPVPPAVQERLPFAYRMISMSEFGHKELKDAGYHSTYIPHSIEPEVFQIKDKKEARKKLGLPEDGFIFGMVSANKENPPRKGFQHAMEAFKMFHDKHPNSYLYLHLSQQTPGGFPIDSFAKVLGIEKQIFQTPEYAQMVEMSASDMSYIYSAFDCLLCPSTNEGFGVPIIESQMCGTPVIATDFTSMTELIKEGITGELCKVQDLRFDPQQAFIATPDTKDLYNKMERVAAYKDTEKTQKDCRKHIIRRFSDDVVFDKYWKPFIEKLKNELVID